MASRKAAPRARVNSTMAPPQVSRPRSVMAQHPPLPPPPPPKTQAQEDSETNIQVVIRCRRRSEREIQDNSPIIVSSSGPRSNEVTIETSTPVSSLGMVTLPPTRTYPFDLVFGPEADQALLYHDVVAPLLSEVIQGYNCTLFAYGQTGTGKTYTMQGDLTLTPMGNPSPQAGMIPRVLFRLFHDLETSGTDYSVKISFVELYNEELRDLLTSELAAPVGSIQPMGQGAGASKDGSAAQRELKIFDESNKKGVFIQGLEEVCVKDAADALALLTKGSHRRQIAATKFNDHSSRSHSVFSITVHIKEVSSMGDDLLKVGKLNLVDLAGSENIGRSGAENKRAREAGMINQSLLTLGRVINALVDRSQHVPYRESKLTRLLQDSLGGRTKTCIIATISPARSNIEETLSTLDYAIRAKSIRNKPEVNQRMTRNALLKEYVAEIERLKADVLAAREKNGIFFSEETWNQMTVEQELRQTEYEEARKQVDIVESQMRAVREEFEQSIALFMKTDGELKATRQRLKLTEGELATKDGELRTVKEALEEEVVVRQAHQETEGMLDGVATGLKKVVGESLEDVEALFEKIARKGTTLSSNSKAVLTHSKTVSSEVKFLTGRLDEFVKLMSQLVEKLRTEAKDFQASELQAFAHNSGRIDQQLKLVDDALGTIRGQDKISQEAIGAVKDLVKDTGESVKAGLKTWSESLAKSNESLCKEVEGSVGAGFAAAEKALKAMGVLIESVVREAREYMDAERKAALDAKSFASAAADVEVARLREQNAMLTQLLESERAKNERAQVELVQRIAGLLSEFAAGRDQGWADAVQKVKEANVRSESKLVEFGERHGRTMDEMVERAGNASKIAEKRCVEGRKTRDTALTTMNSTKANAATSVANLQTSTSASLASYSIQTQQQLQNLHSTSSTAFDRHGRAKRARIEATASMHKEVQADFAQIKRGLASTSSSVEGVVGRVVSQANAASTAMEAYHKAAAAHLLSARQAVRSLAEQGSRDDVPTGRTPRKRAWEYVDEWELTKPRDTVIKSWRGKEAPNVESQTFLAEHSPLQEDKERRGEIAEDIATPIPPEPMKVGEIHPAPEHVKVGDREPSPPFSPLDSSASSSSSIPIPPPILVRKKTGRSGLPTMGTLTDQATNIGTGRRTRRVR